MRLPAVGFFFGGTQFAFSTYIVLYLNDSGYSLTAAVGLLTVAQALAAGNRVICGIVSDRRLNGRRKPLLQGIGGAGMVALATLAFPHVMPHFALGGAVVLFGVSVLSWGVMYQTLAAELAGCKAAGLGSGIATTLVKVGGMAMPFVFGYVADVRSFTSAWGVLIGGLAIAMVLLAMVKTAPALARREEQAEPEPRLLPQTAEVPDKIA